MGRLQGPVCVFVGLHRLCPTLQIFATLLKRADTICTGLPPQHIWGLAGRAQPRFWLCHSANDGEMFAVSSLQYKILQVVRCFIHIYWSYCNWSDRSYNMQSILVIVKSIHQLKCFYFIDAHCKYTFKDKWQLG